MEPGITESGAKSRFAPDRGQMAEDIRQKTVKTMRYELAFVSKMLATDFCTDLITGFCAETKKLYPGIVDYDFVLLK
jgi:hypothetical protein